MAEAASTATPPAGRGATICTPLARPSKSEVGCAAAKPPDITDRVRHLATATPIPAGRQVADHGRLGSLNREFVLRRRYQRSPASARRSSTLWEVLAGAVLGAVIGGAALLVVHDRFESIQGDPCSGRRYTSRGVAARGHHASGWRWAVVRDLDVEINRQSLIGFTVVFVGLSCLGIRVDRAGLDGRIGWTLAGPGVAAVSSDSSGEPGDGVVPRRSLPASAASVGAWVRVALRGLGGDHAPRLRDHLGARRSDDRAEPRSESEGREPNAVLGDTYISGEGVLDYFEERTTSAISATNAAGSERLSVPRCRAAGHGSRLLRLLRSEVDRSSEGRADAELAAEIPGARAQLGNLSAFAPSQLEAIDVVLVSIGGNDVGFSTIIQACLLPEDCNQLRRLEGQRRAIGAEAGDDVQGDR